MSQELQEQVRQATKVFTEYERAFKAIDLITSGAEGVHNANLLLNYLMEYFGGVITVPNIIAAEKALGAKLFRVKPKTAAEIQQEQAEKAEARMRQDYINSIKPQPVYDPKKAEQIAESEKWTKSQTTARNELNAVITEYSTNRGPNLVDHTASEMVRNFLKRIGVPAPKGKAIDATGRDYIATVQWVRAVKFELPDHPVLGDPEKALQRVRDKFAAHAAAKSKPDRNNAW